jgi:hypothetical protein
MRRRIQRGQVPGLDDPADAEKIVQRGTITYKQARNIARAGNIDSLTFDAKTQSVTSSYVLAISFGVTYAQNLWHGEPPGKAIQTALVSAINSGSTTLISGVVSAQILRTKAAAIGHITLRSGLKVVSGNTIGREAIHRIAAGSLGKAVYGASAINHVSKLLRSNAVTATVVTVTTATPDFYRAVLDRSISWRQFTKNLSVNIAGVGGGAAGWLAGAGAGAAAGSVIPGPGTAVGGVIGGFLGALFGGTTGSSLAKKVADKIAEDDSVRLLQIVRAEIESLSFDYMLAEEEVAQVVDHVKKTLTPKWLRKMFKQSGDQEKHNFVQREFEPCCKEIVEKRPKITLPSPESLSTEIQEFVDSIASSIVDDEAAA